MLCLVKELRLAQANSHIPFPCFPRLPVVQEWPCDPELTDETSSWWWVWGRGAGIYRKHDAREVFAFLIKGVPQVVSTGILRSQDNKREDESLDPKHDGA